MPVDIRNLTPRFVLVPLNSGRTLRLSPGQTSGELPDVEVQNNPKVDKLVRQHTIAVERPTVGPPPRPHLPSGSPMEKG